MSLYPTLPLPSSSLHPPFWFLSSGSAWQRWRNWCCWTPRPRCKYPPIPLHIASKLILSLPFSRPALRSSIQYPPCPRLSRWENCLGWCPPPLSPSPLLHPDSVRWIKGHRAQNILMGKKRSWIVIYDDLWIICAGPRWRERRARTARTLRLPGESVHLKPSACITLFMSRITNEYISCSVCL